MKITKALVTSAGFGTRFLPITKTQQKEMLPILNRPVIDYIVQDCVDAGIKEIIFVINEHNMQVQHYYQENPRLLSYLEKMGKAELYKKVANIHTKAKFTFIKQLDTDMYGTAVPVKIAEEKLKNEEAFLVLMGDDFIYNGHDKPEVQKMIKLFEQTEPAALMTCIERPEEQLHKYGIAKIKEMNGFTFLEDLVEKPQPGSAPSNLSNISKYIFTPQVFDKIRNQQPDKNSGELYITDTVLKLAQESSVVIHKPTGEYLDCGDIIGWLKANLTVAKNDPSITDGLSEIVKF